MLIRIVLAFSIIPLITFSSGTPAEFSHQARLSTEVLRDGSGHPNISGDTLVFRSLAGVHVYVRTGTSWALQQTLTPSDGNNGSLSLGNSVDIDGDTIVIGCLSQNVNGNINQGAAYVFVRNGSVWTEQQRLIADDGAADDRFGSSVAISGGTILIGSPRSDIESNSNQGSAYVFVRSGSSWTQQAKLTGGVAGQLLGNKVSLDVDTAAVGTFPGIQAGRTVFLFVRSGTEWEFQQELSVCEVPDDTNSCNFPSSIALGGDRLVVGNSGLDTPTPNAGGVYVFRRTGGVWTQEQRLIASDGQSDDGFGTSVAIGSNLLVVGAPAANVRRGSVYIFSFDGSAWTLLQPRIQFNGLIESDLFGGEVALDADTMLANLARESGMPGNSISALHVFTRPQVDTGPITIRGSVFGRRGRSSYLALVSNTDSQGNVRWTRTNSFGYYSFTSLPRGGTYTLEVKSRGPLNYDPVTIQANDDLTIVNFEPSP